MTFRTKRHFRRNKIKFVIGGLLILAPTSRILFYGPSVFLKKEKCDVGLRLQLLRLRLWCRNFPSIKQSSNAVSGKKTKLNRSSISNVEAITGSGCRTAEEFTPREKKTSKVMASITARRLAFFLFLFLISAIVSRRSSPSKRCNTTY